MINDQDLLSSPAVRAIVERVHGRVPVKTASLQEVVRGFGVKLSAHQLGKARIASALKSLEALR